MSQMTCAEYLAKTSTLNYDHPAILQFVSNHTTNTMSPQAAAISLYYAVRDRIRYNPYVIDLTIDGMKASTTLTQGFGWCVSKAVLLAACCRSLGIPARLGFGDVRNHLSTKRMREWMQTDVFYWHGYAELHLNERWVKATPAFNRELCNRFNLIPLEFDGEEDSILHSFDLEGNRHMEYLLDRGRYPDLPLKEITATFAEHYGMILEQQGADFESDVADENR